MRTLPLAALAVAALACEPGEPGLALFDLTDPERGAAEPAVVELWVEHGEARLRVTQVLHNSAHAGTELEVPVPLPPGGVVTALRVEVEGRWREASLESADAASERFHSSEDFHAGGSAPAVMVSWDGGAPTLGAYPLAATEALWGTWLPTGTPAGIHALDQGAR